MGGRWEELMREIGGDGQRLTDTEGAEERARERERERERESEREKEREREREHLKLY